MNNLGELYDKIAIHWDEELKDSHYGLKQLELALQFVENKEKALDVGCGSGGRFIFKLRKEGFQVTGIDVSFEMIQLAKTKHPQCEFIHENILNWNLEEKYDLILAWDSLFHLPLNEQENVLKKLCNSLKINGIIFYTFGDAVGEHYSDWHNEKFYYSSIGINENLKILMENNCECKHLALDQFPQSHVFLIAKKV